MRLPLLWATQPKGASIEWGLVVTLQQFDNHDAGAYGGV